MLTESNEQAMLRCIGYQMRSQIIRSLVRKRIGLADHFG
jgi:hypothetical protein